MLNFKLSSEKRQLIYDMAFNATQDFLDKLSEKERLRKQEEIELEMNTLMRNEIRKKRNLILNLEDPKEETTENQVENP